MGLVEAWPEVEERPISTGKKGVDPQIAPISILLTG